MGPADDEHQGRWATEALRLLEILALTGAAVVEPVLGSFGRSPETFTGAGASRTEVIVFGLLVAVVPAVLLWAAGLAVGAAGPRARRAVHSLTLGVLAATVVVRVIHRFATPAPLLVTAAAVVGLAATVLLYDRVAATRIFLRYLSVLPVVLLAVFVAASPVSKLVFPPAASGATARGGDPVPIVMIVADELPTETLLDDANRIDPTLFPNLASFAGGSTWYRNNTAVASFTQGAVPALVSGLYPSGDLPQPVQYSHNLFSWLNDSHRLNVWESITSLCTASGCDPHRESGALSVLTAEAWRNWKGHSLPWDRPRAAVMAEDPLGQAVGQRDDRVERFIRSLARPSGRPRLDYMHVLLPHIPWTRLPDGRRYPAPKGGGLGQFVAYWTTDYAAALGRQRHVLQARYFDRLLGRVLDRLRTLGTYDDSLVVVTADHGMAFDAGEPWRGVTPADYSSLPWAPLLVKLPGQTEGRMDERNVEQIDLLPTLAAALGTRLPWEVDGRSFLDGGARPPGAKKIFPWYQDKLPKDADGFMPLDGVAGYRAMLDAPPAVAARSGRDREFRLPPYGDLVGRRVSGMRTGPALDSGFRLEGPDDYRYDGGSTVPAYVWGRFTTPTEEGRYAVAVNGVIAGWGEMRPQLKDDFAVITPPRLFRRGPNRITLYRLDGDPGEVTLRPVPVRG